ncbi:neuropeptides capa receptor-like [Antedon mediterranea]|uniref:neuropeptides capa receptor-like n=1 Tax=Antedon mediterranea TaxID=105859 RepID=UPI003AF8B078
MTLCIGDCYTFKNLTESNEYSNWETICVCYVFPVIMSVGVITNISFMFVSYRISYLHTAVNNFLINLSIADIIFLLIAVGEKLNSYYELDVNIHSGKKTFLGCTVTSILKNSSSFTAQILVTLIALERYRVICYPIRAYTIHSRVRVRRQNFGSWVIAVLLSASMSPAVGKEESYCGVWPVKDGEFVVIDICGSVNKGFVIYYEFIQTVPFFIAWTITSITHILIVIGLKKSNSDSRLHPKGSKALTRAGNQITAMLLINGVTFFLLLAPFQITSLMAMIKHTIGDYNSDDPSENHTFLNIGRLLLYMNAAINPIIYVIVNQRYRNAYVLVFWRCRRQDDDEIAGGRPHSRQDVNCTFLNMKDGFNRQQFDTYL